MKAREVIVGPGARADMARIADYIAIFVSPTNGEDFLIRIFDFVWRLDLAAQRGIDRSDIHPGLRVIPFERRANLAVVITDATATVVRVFHRGQDWESALRHQYGRSP
jgi:toxin ParE1/3/4